MTLKMITKLLNENLYLFIGIIIGIYISTIIDGSFNEECTKSSLQITKNETNMENINIGPLPIIKESKKAKSDNKKKVIRPRYYSTELGIREKLFVGIFTSEEKVNSHAVHLNKTVGHLVDKIKFFITAQYKLKTKFNLTGLVGFTDARYHYRPFQVIKYVADTFNQDYDYYYFAKDYTFTNVHRLKDVVNKISIGMNVYLGTKVKDGSFCSLDSGVLISNSVLKAMRANLDWCIINTVSDDNSENFGRCVYHSMQLNCQENIQDVSLDSYKLKHFELDKHLLKLSKLPVFNDAVTVYPILQKDDFYLLNAYFLRQRLEKLKSNIDELSTHLNESWPAGQRTGAKPATRFDLPRQYYFNLSHVYHPDDFTMVREHTEPEKNDIENILNQIKAKSSIKNKDLKYKHLINGYKKFDLSRGMDYTFDIFFTNDQNEEITKRFQVSKPLSKVEFLQVPYVTENSRVTILLPIQKHEVALGLNFLKNYVSNIMLRKEKTMLMLVFMYQYNSENKGDKDVFADIKRISLKTSQKYKNDDTKIAWVSIRLPPSNKTVTMEDNSALNLAVVDLSLKKVGLESLMLFLDVYCNISVDFLNRVRMNTINNYQIFNPIPFRQYDPKITYQTQFEVNKNVGHFERDNYKYISFYGKDYVLARKKYQHIVPLIRVDNDIINILGNKNDENAGNIFKMFLQNSATLHCMRATEMSLKIFFHEETDHKKDNLFLGTEGQIAKLLLSKIDILK